MNRFFEAFKNLFRIPDLRNRVLFTLALLAVYRIGAHIPTPGINWRVLETIFQQGAGSFLGIFDLFSGGNLRRLTIFALGIMPYITSSIILQLMTVVFPYLEKLQKEGELGRRKITQYTRYLTIVLSIIQSTTIATALQSTNYGGESLVFHPGPGFILMTILTLTTGSAFIMWLGEQISERGIGNGMSLIIFVGIVVGLPRAHPGSCTKRPRPQAWGPFTPLVADLPRCPDDRGRGLHRLRRRRAAPHSGAIRQARRRSPRHGRAILVSPAARQFRRRDSADLSPARCWRFRPPPR